MRFMGPSYELFDHTADIGIRVRADSLEGLLQPASEALYTVIGELFPGGDPSSIAVELSDSESSILLRDYLAELLFLLERDNRLATAVEVARFCDGSLEATVQTERVDPARSVFHHEVKAITYHQLDIVATPGGVEATIIVDI